MSLPPLPDVFGNYAIRGIAELVAPQPVSWMPVTAGWKLLGGLLTLLLLYLLFRIYRRWRHNRYRRLALRQLDALPLDDPAAAARMAIILKSAALAAFPRSGIAALSGEQWLAWLRSTTEETVFGEGSAVLLAEKQYQRQTTLDRERLTALKRDCATWLRSHRERPA